MKDIGIAIPTTDQIRDVDTWDTAQGAQFDPLIPIVYAKIGRTVAPLGAIGFHAE